MRGGATCDPGTTLAGLVDLRISLTDEAHVALVSGAERRVLDRWLMSNEFEGSRALWHLRKDVLRTMRWPRDVAERFWREWDPSGTGGVQGGG